MNTFTIYTDASFCVHTNLAACGYYVTHNDKPHAHNVYTLTNIYSCTTAEVYAILLALQDLVRQGVTYSHVLVYCDNTSAIAFVEDRLRKSYRSLHPLRDMRDTILAELHASVNSLQLEFIKGHRPSLGGDYHYNHLVDVSVRKRLREQRQYYKPWNNEV